MNKWSCELVFEVGFYCVWRNIVTGNEKNQDWDNPCAVGVSNIEVVIWFLKGIIVAKSFGCD